MRWLAGIGLSAVAVLVGAVALPASRAMGETGPDGECRETYTVQRGDMLGDIAARFYGDVRDYVRLHRENLRVIGPDPWVLEVGMVLSVPCERDARPARTAADEAEPLREPREGWRPILAPEGLAALMRTDGRVQVLDVRDPARRAGGVIPGALSAPYARWAEGLDGDVGPVVGASGLRLERPVVIVEEDGGIASLGRAALVYWVLRTAGATEVAILAGGHGAWAARRLPLWAGPAAPEARSARISPDARWRASREEVAAILDGRREGGLVLASPAPAAAIGDPPGMVSLLDVRRGAEDPLPVWTMLGGEEAALAALEWFKALDLPWERAPVAILAETPERGALAWFYASEVAGIRNVRLATALPEPGPDGRRGQAEHLSVACAQKDVQRDGAMCAELKRLPDIR